MNHDISDMFVPQGNKKESYTFAYIVLALGVAVILFHYFVLPHILAHYGI